MDTVCWISWRRLILQLLLLTLWHTFGESQTDDECDGVTANDGTCFTYHGLPVTWPQAEANCRIRGGHLAAASSQDRFVALQFLLNRQGAFRAWIGAFHSDDVWKWTADSGILLPQGCYTDNPTDPDLSVLLPTIPDMTPDLCIAACSTRGYQYAGLQNGTRCYCGDSFGSYGTNSQCTVACPSSTGLSLWCGGPDMNFVYRVDGQYARWGYHQPNNYRGNQNCGVIDTNIESKVGDESCVKELALICEYVSYTYCGVPGHYEVDGHCFHYDSTPRNWSAADVRCRFLGARLAKIQTLEKHETIQKLVGAVGLFGHHQIWIGLQKGKGWQWTAEPVFDFESWDQNYPVRSDTCAYIQQTGDRFGWRDSACADVMKYICQQVSESVAITTPLTTARISDEPPEGTTQSRSAPDSPDASTDDSGLSTVEIALTVVMCLLGLILIILIIVCSLKLKERKKKNKIYYDARPIAPVPNSGDSLDDIYDVNTGSTSELFRGGPW